MQLFTPYEYTRIAVANKLGHDKSNWDVRLDFAADFLNETYEEQVKFALAKSKEPMMAVKAINAHRDAVNGVPSGFLIDFDCTASGIQILSAVTGCKTSAAKVNLINTGNREDIYNHMVKTMTNFGVEGINRDILKDPVMTVFYGSTEQPKLVFGDETKELQHFYNTLEKELPGAWNALQTIQPLWNPNAKRYGFTLPDGHTVDIPVMDVKDYKIEIAEFFKRTFTFRTTVNQVKDFSRELPANITHAIDGYIVRMMYQMAYQQGWQLGTVHDSFWCLPNYVNQMRQNFNQILSDLAKSNIFTDILRELTGRNTAEYKKYSNDLHLDILNANYAIC